MARNQRWSRNIDAEGMNRGETYESPHFVSDSILPLRFRELVC
jgi:hypothetical protein